MRALHLALVLAALLASPALACECIARPPDSVAGTYRAITLLLCLLPLSMAGAFFYWLQGQLRGAAEPPPPASFPEP